MTDLLILYNPYYQNNVIEAHLEVLKDKGLVAFGKVRSKLKDKLKNQNLESANQNTELNLLRLQSLLKASNSGFLQLFLTDYASLYVAKVVDIVANLDENKIENLAENKAIDTAAKSYENIIPSYYREKNLNIDCFFIISDLREIVRDDFVAVRDIYLANLTTPDFGAHTYALYGNAYTYPLAVMQKQHSWYFEGSQRHFLSLFKSHEFLRQKQTLIDYAFGEGYLYALHADSFDNVIYAELEFHANKHDRLYDFSGAILCYAKFFEVECYLFVRALVGFLASKDEGVLRLKFEANGKTYEFSHLLQKRAMLGAYAHIINKLKIHIERHTDDETKGFCKRLPRQIAYIQSVRNPAAHSAFASFEDASTLRAKLIGVGTQSQLLSLVKIRVKLAKMGV